MGNQEQIALVIDEKAIFERVGGKMHILTRMVAVFFEELPDQLDTLKQAIDKKKSEDLQRAAHALKGTVANFGAKSAYEMAQKLENMGRLSLHTGTHDMYQQLETELALVKSALQNLTTQT